MAQLFEFVCVCGKVLVWAGENSKVLCNVCGNWVEVKDMKNPKSCFAEDEETGQLSMF